MGSAPLVCLLMLTTSSEERERGNTIHCHRKPMMAANDWRKFESGRWDDSEVRICCCCVQSGINYGMMLLWQHRVIVRLYLLCFSEILPAALNNFRFGSRSASTM